MKNYILATAISVFSLSAVAQVPPYFCQQTVKLMVYSFPIDLGVRDVYGPHSGEAYSRQEAKDIVNEKIVVAMEACEKRSEGINNSWCTKTSLYCSEHFSEFGVEDFWNGQP